jgi:Domain of unknown function (DUF5666)
MKLLALLQPILGINTRSCSRVIGASLAVALMLTACGGGGNDAAPNNSASANLVSEGVISGFGSVIVNGVRFDDSKAKVEDEDEEENSARSKDDLRLGMVVSVSGSSAGTTGTASAISFGSTLKGPVQSIDSVTITGTTTGTTTGTNSTSTTAAGSHTLVVLGQTVLIGAWTVFDPISLPNGFASIGAGNVLEVHGHLSPALNRLVATRINKENNANAYKITGNVSSLNAASKSFKIGTEMFSYANINPEKLRVTLADGLTIKVRLATVQATTGTWTATRIKPAKKAMPDRIKAEVEGLITAFTSATNFSVNGLVVDASNASFPKGTATLALGVRVEVKGTVVDGKLVATVVKTEDRDRGEDEDNEIELHGNISALDTTAKTFMLRGLAVSYAGNVSFQRGLASNLVNGASVEVKGQSSGGGTTVQATRIKFED